MNINGNSNNYNNYNTNKIINSINNNSTSSDINGDKNPVLNLKEGTVFNGKIINVTNNEVVITTDGANRFTAKMLDSLSLNIGDEIQFFVQENNGKQISIKPYDNQMDQSKINTLLKLLDINGLSATEKNFNIADALISNQMPADKGSMQIIMQQSYNFPDAKIETLVALNKMGIEVNDANIKQYESYVNNTHQIMNDVLDLAQGINSIYKEIGSNGTNAQLFDFNNNILNIMDVTKDIGQEALHNLNNSDFNLAQNSLGNGDNINLGTTGLSNNIMDSNLSDNILINNSQAKEMLGQVININISDESKNSIINLGSQLIDSGIDAQEVISLISNSNSEEDFLSGLNKLINENGVNKNNALVNNMLKDILLSSNYSQLVNTVVKKKFSLDLSEMKNPKEIDELYEGIYDKTNKLMNMLENGSNSQSDLSRSGKAIQEKIDYIQNLNNNYTYAQIPIRNNDREFNSELFVYLNKKRIQDSNKEVSALLHLDMDNLGPTDVHVSLHGNVVHTRFYVEDEISAKLIDDHMNMLELQVVERGLALTNEVITRESKQSDSNSIVVDEIIGNDMEKSVKRYSFDVRM